MIAIYTHKCYRTLIALIEWADTDKHKYNTLNPINSKNISYII